MLFPVAEIVIVQSSSYEVSCIPSGAGRSRMYRLKRSGKRTPPCVTPCLTFQCLDVVLRKSTYICSLKMYGRMVNWRLCQMLLSCFTITEWWCERPSSGHPGSVVVLAAMLWWYYDFDGSRPSG